MYQVSEIQIQIIMEMGNNFMEIRIFKDQELIDLIIKMQENLQLNLLLCRMQIQG